LSRRSFVSNDELGSPIQKDLGRSGCFVGWLRVKGIIVNRARVIALLRELDPDGIESR